MKSGSKSRVRVLFLGFGSGSGIIKKMGFPPGFGTKVTKIRVGLGFGSDSGITKSGFSLSGFQVPDYVHVAQVNFSSHNFNVSFVREISILSRNDMFYIFFHYTH